MAMHPGDATHSWMNPAGIAFRTAGWYLDFHALRHQFPSTLARSGVHPKVAQKLARLSTITLTMDRYRHLDLAELGDALQRLPGLAAAEAQAAPAAWRVK